MKKDNRKKRASVVKLDETQVVTSAKLKYLGLIVDKKLNFIEHVK